MKISNILPESKTFLFYHLTGAPFAPPLFN